jgi:hypothetical protein
VGYIEVEPGTAKKLGRSPITLDRIHDGRTGQAGRMAYLFGCPTALAKRGVNHQAKTIVAAIQSLTYPSAVLAPDEWPKLPKKFPPARKSADLFMTYDRTEEMVVEGKRGGNLPNPVGASGGGIWQMTGPKDDGVWHVGKVKLIAIQSAWDEKLKYIRGVQVRHWLKLVSRDYPDLRSSLT